MTNPYLLPLIRNTIYSHEVEALDYLMRVVTRLTLKGIEELLPYPAFMRFNKSNIVNRDRIDSFDTNDVFIGTTEISIGASYRDIVLPTLLGNF